MYIFGLFWRRLRKLWQASGSLQNVVDSYKWESKVESFRSLSKERYIIPELKDKY